MGRGLGMGGNMASDGGKGQGLQGAESLGSKQEGI